MEREFSVRQMGEITCNKCGKFLCFGGISCHDFSEFLCTKCKKSFEIEDALEHISYLETRIMEKQKQIKCAESLEGHDIEDISYCTLSMGGLTKQCKKCGYTYDEPLDCSLLEFKPNNMFIDTYVNEESASIA